jgi:hypothetical protein
VPAAKPPSWFCAFTIQSYALLLRSEHFGRRLYHEVRIEALAFEHGLEHAARRALNASGFMQHSLVDAGLNEKRTSVEALAMATALASRKGFFMAVGFYRTAN